MIEAPGGQASKHRKALKRSNPWRLTAPLAFAVAGFLFVTSGVNSHGTDLRSGRYSELSDLIQQESTDNDALARRATVLREDVQRLTADVDDVRVQELTSQVEDLGSVVGLGPVTGPGLRVVLDDAPEDIRRSSDLDPNDLIVHQQDLQAVVNSLWAGGAEAMTIQGQRIISTTAVKCVGSTVVLHGVPHSPPYEIVAMGDPQQLLTSVQSSAHIQIYLDYAAVYQLGWSVAPLDSTSIPGYEGLVSMDYAQPVTETDSAGI